MNIRYCMLTVAHAGVALILAGCAVGPKYTKPAPELPAAWAPAATGGIEVRNGRWWTVYADPVLERLIDEALANNANLLVAAARVDEARAALQSATSQQGLSAGINFGASRSRNSERGTQPIPAGSDAVRNSFRGTLDVSYEVDLWDRLRGASAAARADLLASQAAQDTVRITLAAETAQGYFALRALDEQIAVTRRALASRSESLAIQRKRLEFGVLSDFEFRQREAEVAVARAQVPALERSRSQQENALAVLLGRSPREIYEGRVDAGKDAENAAVVITVPSGIPSDLLLRRPDLVEAEQRLIAANARIGVARAFYFPAISLTGYLGSESTALGSLFSGPAGIWKFAAALAQPLWGGGRIDAAVATATARQQQALAQYQGAIQNAFRDVRNAVVAQVKAHEQIEAEAQRATALRETLRLAKLRYEIGLANQLDVLDAERNLLAAEQNRIEALRAQRAAIADLFKGLGGGWT